MALKVHNSRWPGPKSSNPGVRCPSVATTLTGYGGVGEIGGNAFLLDDGASRIFLDFGKRFGNDPRLDEGRGIDTRHRHPGWNDYYDSFLQPRGATQVPDLIRLGIIPDVPSLYREDRGGVAGPAPVDGILFSHAHMDHCGLVGLVRPDVPIIASDKSRATLHSLQETGNGLLSEFIHARPKGILPKKDGSPGKGTQWKDPETGENVAAVRSYTTPDEHEIGPWKLRHYDVDHSIHGARGSIIEGHDLSIVYTGDFRLHGRDKSGTEKFIERAGGVDVVIIEGTRVFRDSDHNHGHAQSQTDDEHQVEGAIESMIAEAGDQFVAVSFPPRDLDRFLSVWHVARKSNRRLVIPTKLAHLIDSVRGAGQNDLPDPLRDPHLAIHVPVRGRGVRAMPAGMLRMPDQNLRMNEVAIDDETWTDFWLSDHETWERKYILGDNAVTSADVAAAPHAYLFSMSYWTINELFDVFPDRKKGGVYIHSMTQPFNDEMEISDRKLQRWLDAFRLERHTTHVSGHLSEEDVQNVLEEIGAKTLVPIHSESPDLTATKYESRTGNNALLPQWGQPLPLA